MPFILNYDPTPLTSQSDEEARPAPTVGLGELLLRVCQRFFLGLAVHRTEPLADPGESIGYPGLGGLTLTHAPDVVAFTLARNAAILAACEAHQHHPLPGRTCASLPHGCGLRAYCAKNPSCGALRSRLIGP